MRSVDFKLKNAVFREFFFGNENGKHFENLPSTSRLESPKYLVESSEILVTGCNHKVGISDISTLNKKSVYFSNLDIFYIENSEQIISEN